MLRQGLRATVTLLALAILVFGTTSQPTRAHCSTCEFQFTKRSGSYVVQASKAGWATSSRAPRIRVTVLNKGSHTLMVAGTSASSLVALNFIGPRSRGTEVVRAAPSKVEAGSSESFYVTWSQQFGAPGVYRFNVSVGRVDSNIIAYTISRSAPK